MAIKEFVLDGTAMNSAEEFYAEVQRVLCSHFKHFGRNLDAFVNVLREGFGAFELDGHIVVRFENKKHAEKNLPESFFRKVLRILENRENIQLVAD